MSNQTSSSGSISFYGLLAIVFITFKLTGVIAWSWWWVLAPIWAGLALWLFILGVILVGALIIGAIAGIVAALFKK